MAIVGYTNAGKSSLLNRMTGAGVLVEDALFATLDPTTRRATTADGRTYTLTDTVGFVRHLPHDLIEALLPPWRSRRIRTSCCTSWTLRIPTPLARFRQFAPCWPKSARVMCPSCSS